MAHSGKGIGRSTSFLVLVCLLATAAAVFRTFVSSLTAQSASAYLISTFCLIASAKMNPVDVMR